MPQFPYVSTQHYPSSPAPYSSNPVLQYSSEVSSTPVKSDSVKSRLHWSNPKVCNDKLDRALLLVADPSRFKTATDTAKLP